MTPATAIHRPSNVLLGVAEQLDLLASGAIPVVVDDPVDAMAVTRLSRAVGEQWAGIPVCGGGLSTAQARMLRRFSVGDKVVIVLSGGEQGVKRSAGYGIDLAYFFDRVRAVDIPDGVAVAVSSSAGTTQVHEALVRARPLLTYRVVGGGLTSSQPDPDPPDVGPEIG
ncbi:hypothetical protein [Kribbella sp. NPDC006257]|uniref:hypothetical protein n=1 Tax=Kribbella sp. NPDC006257 TaxID=3156738 RepID=UPI00339E026E